MKFLAALLLIIIIMLCSCSVCPPATQKNVMKWERKHKFRAELKKPATKSKILALARKY